VLKIPSSNIGRWNFFFCYLKFLLTAMIKRTLLFSSAVYVSTRNEQLIIQPKDDPKNQQQVPIEDVGVVLMEHPEGMMSQGAVCKLLANNAALIYCDKNHLPAGMLLPIEGNSLQQERFMAQIGASLPLKKQLWQQTIIAKIKNQGLVLEAQSRNALPMWNKMKQVKTDDSSNEEAQAARHYWSEVFEHMYFVRERHGLPPNNLLNYGYAVLRAATARALVGSGLLPTLGIHHHNKYNAFCLADDIMEPYRPFVDWLVLDIIKKDEMGYFDLDTKTKRILLSQLTMDVEINGHRSPLLLALSQTTASLVRCFEGETKEIIYPRFCI
jgi:CRISPR-associated protein Cas1